MFDDVERIEKMTYREYKQTMYYLNRPDEYEGDFEAFKTKIVDFGTRVQKQSPSNTMIVKDPAD